MCFQFSLPLFSKQPLSLRDECSKYIFIKIAIYLRNDTSFFSRYNMYYVPILHKDLLLADPQVFRAIIWACDGVSLRLRCIHPPKRSHTRL